MSIDCRLETVNFHLHMEKFDQFGFEQFPAAGVCWLRFFPKRNGEAAELTLKVTAVPAGIMTEVREAVEGTLVDRFDNIVQIGGRVAVFVRIW